MSLHRKSAEIASFDSTGYTAPAPLSDAGRAWLAASAVSERKAKRRAFRSGLVAVSALAITQFATPGAFAGNTWDGGGGSGLWNTNANWNLDTAPSTGVALTFAGNVQNSTSNDLAAVDPSFAGILFTNSGAASNTNAFTLAGSRITLGGNITTTANTAGATIVDIISLDMILDGNRTITTESAIRHRPTQSHDQRYHQ